MMIEVRAVSHNTPLEGLDLADKSLVRLQDLTGASIYQGDCIGTCEIWPLNGPRLIVFEDYEHLVGRMESALPEPVVRL